MSDILMKGTEPIGQVSDLTADNVEYSEGVSVKQAIDNKVSKTGDTITGDLTINRNNGTTSSVGESVLALGNNISQGTAGNSKGLIRFFDNLNHKAILAPSNNMTADRFITLPDKGGTLVVGQVSHLNCTGVASTSHSSGWFYADYEFTLNKTYGSNAVAIVTHQRGVPFIDQADISGNKLYVRIWALASFGTSTSFAVNVFLSENETITA